MASKNERAAQARADAQAAVKAKERRTTAIIIAASLVVIVGFGALVFFISNSSTVPTLADMWASPNPPVPAGSDETGGIGVGTGGVVGVDVPTDALRVDVYVDLLCPYCNRFEETNSADLDALREDGTIALYYHPISILDPYSAGTKYPTRAANAVAVVADQDPAHFLDFIAALYAEQPEEKTPGLTDDQIAEIAEGVGVPSDVAASFAGGEFTNWVTAATDQASIDGLASTPTVMVDREVLDPQQVNFLEPGALKTYLESAAAAG